MLYLLESPFNFTHAVGSVEYRHSNRLIPEMIIVGIRNTHRNLDLSRESPDLSTEERERMGTSGEAHNFLAFLEKELIPQVEKTKIEKKLEAKAGKKPFISMIAGVSGCLKS